MFEYSDMTAHKNIFETKRREIYWQLKEIGLEEQEAQAEAALIVEQVSGLKQAQQIISDLNEFSIKWQDEIARIINLRRERRPLAYALGEIEFAGLAYRIIPGVLIPRTDTETLVEAVVEWGETATSVNGAEAALNIAEIGVGSGIIAISLLKRLPNARVWACDISETAITLATGNARRHGVHERLKLVHGDWKKVLPKDFDVIVSNPPYIPNRLDNKASKELAPEIYFEPKEALFAGEDGLDFYRQFAQILPRHFSSGSDNAIKAGLSDHAVTERLSNKPNTANKLAAFEIGDGQEEAVTSIFKKQGWTNIQIKKDINNLPRVLIATPP